MAPSVETGFINVIRLQTFWKLVMVSGGWSHLDGQHHVRVALQHLHGAAVADVLEADAVGRQDLVAHLYSILLRQTAGIQPETGGLTERWARARTVTPQRGHRGGHLLGDVDAETKLLSSSDVEAQAVIV